MTILYPQLKNFIQNDPLSDWFEFMDQQYHCYERVEETTFELDLKEKKYQYKQDFFSFLKQYQFHCENELDHHQMKQRFESKVKGIFIDCYLYHRKYDILLKPDLILHRDIFKEIFKEVTIDNLSEYIVCDILYKTVHFNADQTDILNDDNLYYHKCKLYLCSQCIDKSFQKGYLFAKEYKHKEKSLRKKESIGYFQFDTEMIAKIKEALSWINNLYEFYDDWIIYPKPTIKELYPNMNNKTGPWYKEKKKLAESIKEITLVWNISYHKRCLLYDRGITTWDDPILLRNIYPYEIRESKREYIQEKMIHINSQNELKIQPRRIKNQEFIHHIRNQKNSIILDIESVLKFDEKESYFTDEIYNEHPKICIIGTIINHNNIFKDFTIKTLNEQEEKKIIQYWLLYLKKSLKTDLIKVYHWGNAEKIYLTYMKEKYSDLSFPQFELVDLLSYFKEEPITIQGCFGYGLKEIVKMLYTHNLIENQWEDDTDGLEAMIQFIQKSEEAEQKNIPLKRFTEIRKIIYYNYMDCKVIVDILQMLQKMI